jgi:hypothetical protein
MALAVLLLPKVLFAQGAVVGYLWGGNTLTDAQLDKLTHVIASDIGCKTTCFYLFVN